MQFKSNFLAKESLFKGPLGWIMRSMGGQAVDRSKNRNIVDQVVDIFNREEEFKLAITPEGTRKKVKEWRTGFYHIARMANIPLILSAMDWGRKEVRFSAPFYPGDDMEEDMRKIKHYFSDATGRFHSQYGH
jgi:1-acyl-sn-glycerol-3-phosphate acyltransferase